MLKRSTDVIAQQGGIVEYYFYCYRQVCQTICQNLVASFAPPFWDDFSIHIHIRSSFTSAFLFFKAV